MEFPKKTPEYADLKTFNEPWDIVYGPFASRRLGNSIGINLLGKASKICSFDCPYCELGLTKIRMNEIKKAGTFQSVEALETEIRRDFDKIAKSGTKIDTIAFVGNGEPTLYPDLDLIVPKVKILRDEFFPKVPLAILTNGSTLDSKKVIKALSELDLQMVKLDAGNDRILKKINAPLVKESVEALIANCRKLKNVIIQSCFVQGSVDNTLPEDIDDWIEAVGMIRPSAVHIYTIDRVPPTSGLKKAEEDTLYTIAAKLEKRTRIKSKVFY